MIKLNKINYSILLISSVALGGCAQSNPQKSDDLEFFDSNNRKYLDYKKTFEDSLVDHFPANLESFQSTTIVNTNIEKNDIGLLLYEYNVDHSKIDSISSCIGKMKYLARYNSEKDSCLLIINQFETFESNKYGEIPIVDDTNLLNNDCYEGKFPVPNFIDYSLYKNNLPLKLDNSFEIYVIDASHSKCLKKYNTKPNPQMPDKWKSGYSKGVAISKIKRTVIYWCIFW